MRPLRALVPLALLVLCGGRCDPFGDPEGHEFLYLAILPPDTAFVYVVRNAIIRLILELHVQNVK